jgi:hypothetical protein
MTVTIALFSRGFQFLKSRPKLEVKFKFKYYSSKPGEMLNMRGRSPNLGDFMKNESKSIDVDKVTTTFVELLKTPGLASARYDENEHGLNIYSEWSYDDISKKERLSMVKVFTVLKSSLKDQKGNLAVVPSTPIPYDA